MVEKRPLRKGVRQSGYRSVGARIARPFLYLFAVPETVLLHRRLTPRRRGIPVPRKFFACADYPNPTDIGDMHPYSCCAALLYSRVPSLALRAIHLVPRLRRPKLDVAVRYLTLRIGGYNAERKILCRTLFFAAVSSLPLPPCPLREKGRFTRGWKTAGCLPSCAPAARSGTPRRGSRKNSPPE